MNRGVLAVLGAVTVVSVVAAQAPIAPPAPPAAVALRPARAPHMSWSGHRMGSVFMRAHGGQTLDAARTTAFFTSLSGSPAAICEMAVDNLGNGWGWANGSTTALRDQSAAARSDRAAYGQAELEESAVPVAVAGLNRTDACSRRAAARLLGQSELASASRALRDAARQSDPRVREAALLGIGIREDSANYEVAAQALDDRDADVVRMAAWAVGEFERPVSVPLLLPLLKRSEGGIRIAVAEALGSIEDQRATKPLLPLLGDNDPAVRIAAIDALASLEDPAAIPALGALLKDDNRDIRLAVVGALGSIEGDGVTSHLVVAMKDRDSEVRRAAAEALGNR